MSTRIESERGKGSGPRGRGAEAQRSGPGSRGSTQGGPGESAPGPSPVVGVLALQGDFAAHANALLRAGGGAAREIRRPAELAGCAALVLPGGESTTLVKLLKEEGLWDPLRRFARGGGAILGTCAGLILMAAEVRGPAQDSLALLPVTVQRNGYGRQVESRVVPGRVRVPPDLAAGFHARPSAEDPAPAATDASFATEFVFIRAPRIVAVEPGVEVLAECAGDPVLVRAGLLLAATFHPEVASDDGIVRLFLALARRARAARG